MKVNNYTVHLTYAKS